MILLLAVSKILKIESKSQRVSDNHRDESGGCCGGGIIGKVPDAPGGQVLPESGFSGGRSCAS